MSMETWEIRGYGIEFGNNAGTNTTGDKIRALLEFAPEFKSRIQNCFEDIELDYNEATVEDFADFEQDYHTGIPYIIAQVMNERYDAINFMLADTDENCAIFLYMPASMPWEMTDFEKSISEEQLKAMILENYKILYDDTPYIGQVSIHNFG